MRMGTPDLHNYIIMVVPIIILEWGPGSPFSHEIGDPLTNIGPPSSYSEILTTIA